MAKPGTDTNEAKERNRKMIDAKHCRRELLIVLGIAWLWITPFGTVCTGADRELSAAEVSKIQKLEADIAKQIEDVEKSFADYVEKLEQAFSSEVQTIEKNFAQIIQQLEKQPGNQNPLKKVPHIKTRIQKLAGDVERLKESTKFPGRSARLFEGEKPNRKNN